MTIRILIGLLAGGVLGFGWHKLAGCSTGACPLTANPWISTAYGMVVGALLASAFR
jgi:hypothetical protein